jgi:hypothetical protein
LSCGTGPAPAENGRDFAGSYEITNLTDWGEDLSLTLTLRIFNYSGADVTDVQLTLNDPLLFDQVYADLGVIDVVYRDQVLVTNQVTVPAEEYERWREGRPPQVSVEYLTADGDPAWRPVELMPMPIGEE